MQNHRDWKDFKREDLTPLYERLGNLVDAEVQAHPAPDLEFMPVHRGAHTVGLLTPREPRPAPVEVGLAETEQIAPSSPRPISTA